MKSFKEVDFTVNCKCNIRLLNKIMNKLLSGHTDSKNNCHFYTAGSPTPKITRAYYNGKPFLV